MRSISVTRNILTLTLVLAVLIGGCASFQQIETRDLKPDSSAFASSENGWWSARFRMNWPQDAQPAWHLDLFLAHQIVLPVLKAYPDEIFLWRVHRRAARDDSGHQFSFIFFAPAFTAQQIFQTFRQDDLLQAAMAAGLISAALYDDTASILKPNIEDTSDLRWSPYIQAAWPHYIMGVSRMWLGLVADIAEDTSNGSLPASIAEIETFYQDVNDTISALWVEEGRHAFLHHLNAIFGYEPVIFYEKRFLNF